MKDKELIATLAADLKPVSPAAPVGVTLLLWLLVSSLYVVSLTLLFGPFRPGAFYALVYVPRYGFELLLGVGAFVAFARVALAEAVPGIDVRWWRRIAWVLLAGWLLQFLLAFNWPMLEPTMLGKRLHCAWESYLYSVPPLLYLVRLQRQRYPLQPQRAVFHAALAAGLLPALIMQLACMYEPSHVLLFHVLPVAGLGAVATFVSWLYFRRKGR
ncbi:MAG: NrsF family protein [Pseudomonadota bacterium]